MNPVEAYKEECKKRIALQGKNQKLLEASGKFIEETILAGYSYNFTWMGRPIIQYPQDMVAMQEIIWEVQPDLIIETGIAHGGSVIYYASILELIGKGEVLGIDIDIREHNRIEIERHPMSKRIKMLQGSAISEQIIEQVKPFAAGKNKVMVCLDSNHTHAHVLKELELYAPFVTVGSYLVAFDTIVEDLPAGLYTDRPWSVGDNPKTAVYEFLKGSEDFIINHEIDNKLLVSVAPSGYLKRVK
ncbi:MAG: cephalosporin hydroxylase family protein [Chitinophagaceae bacterium]